MPGDCCAAGFQPGLCPLRVKTGGYRIATSSTASPRSTDKGATVVEIDNFIFPYAISPAYFFEVTRIAIGV
jgi:hypothetical protein